MLAGSTAELRFLIPAWGDILIALIGAAYLVFGGQWPRLFDVLSMTVLGCLVGLVASVWVPIHAAIVIGIGGLLVGGLTAFFRNIAHAILTGLVLAAVFSVLAGLAAGQNGFASYLVVDVSVKSLPMKIAGPNLAYDPVLAATLAGLLAGVTLAVVRFDLSDRVATCVQGAALVILGALQAANLERGENQVSLAELYPLTLAAGWLCLVAVGLAGQAAMHEWALRRQAAAEMPFDEEDHREA